MAPTRPLLVLTLAVLAAHVMVLRRSTETVQAPPRPAPAFLIRTVAAPSTVAATPVPAAQRPAAVRPPARPDPAGVIRPTRMAAMVAAAARETEAAPSQAKPETAPPPAPAVQRTGAPIGPVVVPGSVRLLYRVDVRRGGLSLEAQGELRWRQDGTNYEAHLEVRAPLLRTRTQHSTGRITAEGLAPLRFSDKGRSEEAAHFDRDQGKVSFSTNRPDTALLPGAQDRLSVLVQLGAIVAGAPPKFPPGAAIALQTAGTREAEPWVFVVEGEEQLELPGGKLRALKLTRSPRKEYDVKVELWLAPGMDYVPVRLRLTQPNGDSVDQQWSSTDRG
jgi:hypothetical protein